MLLKFHDWSTFLEALAHWYRELGSSISILVKSKINFLLGKLLSVLGSHITEIRKILQSLIKVCANINLLFKEVIFRCPIMVFSNFSIFILWFSVSSIRKSIIRTGTWGVLWKRCSQKSRFVGFIQSFILSSFCCQENSFLYNKFMIDETC